MLAIQAIQVRLETQEIQELTELLVLAELPVQLEIQEL
jgi:hypothetical protein